jgi:hypothetical protein
MSNTNIIVMSQIMPLAKLIWTSLSFWRNLSIVLLALILIVLLFKDRMRIWLVQPEKIKHDKELFQLLDLLMPERKLLDLLAKLEKDKAYEINSLQFIDKFRASLKEQTRQYLMAKIRKAAKTCQQNLDDLREFMDANFILFPDSAESDEPGQVMYPNPGIDGGGNEKNKNLKKFAAFTQELKMNTAAAKKSYQKYRSLVQEIIQI